MVVVPALFLLAAVTVRQDTPLRQGCEADAAVVGQAKAGETAQIRFALAAGPSTCYKIATAAGAGFVYADQLEGLESFVRARSTASSVSYRAPATAVPPQTRKDATALAAAGLEAYRGDNPRLAVEYWRASLELRPDAQLQRMVAKVEREIAGDRSSEKSVGARFNLRYEGPKVAPEVARQMVDTLEAEYSRISLQLGCRADERLTVVVQSREAYLKTTGAAEWSGGLYDGKIRVALIDGENGVGPRTRKVFAHELVHACLASLGRWPLWFHEGMAQRLSGEQLPPQTALTLKQLKDVPRLEELSTTQPELAYALSLTAANLFVERYSAYGIRNVLNNPAKFGEVQAELNRTLAASAK
jgi:hypothetical protein